MKKNIALIRVSAPAIMLLLMLAGCRDTSKPGIVSEETEQGSFTVTACALPRPGTAGMQAKGTALEAATLSAQVRAKELFPDIDVVKLGETESSSFDGTSATVTYRVSSPSIKTQAGSQ